MGDIADMMMEGTLCAACGVYEDEFYRPFGPDLMAFCWDCASDPEAADTWKFEVQEHPDDAKEAQASKEESRTEAALDLIYRYGSIDGNHHKQWVLDQVVRALKGPDYDAWVTEFCDGEDGPNTYFWDEGIAP
jgi:hypothetical protein